MFMDHMSLKWWSAPSPKDLVNQNDTHQLAYVEAAYWTLYIYLAEAKKWTLFYGGGEGRGRGTGVADKANQLWLELDISIKVIIVTFYRAYP